jgi:tagatose 6-phosphate kinase
LAFGVSLEFGIWCLGFFNAIFAPVILCIGPTPAAQRVMVFRRLALDAVNRASTTLDGAAGKSVNVAKVLKVLGEHPVATGFLGGDRGEFVRAALEAKGIIVDFVSVAASTRQCITVIDEAKGAITELVEESLALRASDYQHLLATVRRLTGLRATHQGRARLSSGQSRRSQSVVASSSFSFSSSSSSWPVQRFKNELPADACQAVVMSGTITPGGPADFYQRCTVMAHAAGALSLVDAKGEALIKALKARPSLVKPNRTELAATVAHDLINEAAVRSAMRELCQHGAQRVVVTAGKDPVLAFDGHNFWRIHPPRVAAVNPIGSGDAFAAGLVWRLVRGEDLSEACRWAAAAGVANALTLMPGNLDAQEVQRLARDVKLQRL